MSDYGDRGPERYPVREFISDFFCWVVFPLLGIILFIIGGVLVYSVILNLLYLGVMLFLATPSILALFMFVINVKKERGVEIHVPLFIIGQFMMIAGAFIGPAIGTSVNLQVGSWILFGSVVLNFIGFLAWLNLWYMRSIQ